MSKSSKPPLFKKLKKRLSTPLLEGNNALIDRLLIRFFDQLNHLGKQFTSEGAKEKIYNALMGYLLEVVPGYNSAQPLLGSFEDEQVFLAYKKRRLLQIAQPCDIILIRGNQRISRIIQTLTASPYSHAAFYKGEGQIIEAEPSGVLVSSIDKYIHLDIRVCRPVMLTEENKQKVLSFMEKMLYEQPRYDVTNIEQLLFKHIYSKFRPDAKMYIGGSTRFEQYYICSGMIAHAFQKAGYPVAAAMRFKQHRQGKLQLKHREDFLQMVTHLRKNYSQVVPADFDNSPFFTSIKYLYFDSWNQSAPNERVELEQEGEDEAPPS